MEDEKNDHRAAKPPALDYVRKLHEQDPETNKTWTATYLAAGAMNASRSALGRSDLTENERHHVQLDTADFFAAMEFLHNLPDHEAVTAVALAGMAGAFFLGLRAGLSVEEMYKLRAGVAAEMGRKGGKVKRKVGPWEPRATVLAQICLQRNPNAENSVVIRSIVNHWGQETLPKCPSQRTLERFANRRFGLESVDKPAT